MKYITLFDRNYLCHGLALIESMKRHCQPFELDVLALDNETYDRLDGIENVHRYHLDNFLDHPSHNPELRSLRDSRSWQELCWTLEPLWVERQLHSSTSLSHHVIYIDSDCYFFSDPHRHFLLIKPNHAVGLCPHNFPNPKRSASKGRYNFGFAYFRYCLDTLDLVKTWSASAIESCSDQSCGHQTQLNEWPQILGDRLFEFDRSINCGPWQHPNIEGFPPQIINDDGSRTPLVMAHMHEFRRTTVKNKVSICGEDWGLTNYPIAYTTRKSVYEPYIESLSAYLS